MRSLEELLAPSEEEWDEMVNNFTDEENDLRNISVELRGYHLNIVDRFGIA